MVASALVVAGVAISGLSLTAIKAERLQELAQATPTPEHTSPPAESKPGGTRPTTPAPEPARPDAEAQQQGVKAALPPAPAEKIAPPMDKK